MTVRLFSAPQNGITPIGAPVYWIDDRQNSVRGTFVRRESALVVMDLDRRLYKRRIRRHARSVFHDYVYRERS